jgi:hypothetical protein
MVHDYTVVIPVDTTSAGSDYETTIGFYNVLNSGDANLANGAVKAKSYDAEPDGHDHLPMRPRQHAACRRASGAQSA